MILACLVWRRATLSLARGFSRGTEIGKVSAMTRRPEVPDLGSRATHRELATAVWPQLDGVASTLIVPLGSTEQHGPHLPLGTDTHIAEWVARAAAGQLAEERDDVWLAPAIAYGASGEHEGFPGTVSIGTEALRTLLVEFGRSACRWASRVVFVNGHGGNGQALLSATRLLREEGRDVAWFPCAFPDADAHAGRTETAVLLAISPGAVQLEAAERGVVAPIGELLERLRAEGVAGVSPNGVLGDPTGAQAEAGASQASALAAQLVAAVQAWTVDQNGRLR